MDSLLKEISVATDTASVKLKDEVTAYNALDDDIKAQIQRDSLSLLGLKNHTMLAYLHHLAVVTLAQVSRVEKEQKDDALEKGRQSAIRGTVKNRVVLEKGIKGLESKVNYQIDKMLKAYTQDKERKAEREKLRLEKEALGEEEEEEKEEDEDDESESEDDNLAFKPSVANLSRDKNFRTLREARKEAKASEETEEESKEIYRPPKISAIAPESKSARKSHKKNATMEEYLKYSSSAPMVEQSIGSGILEHGRGGEKTDRDRKREAEVQRYEEDNFTRLAGPNKKERSKLKKARAGAFFGEDWGIGGDVGEATKRKRGGASVWEKSKKRR